VQRSSPTAPDSRAQDLGVTSTPIEVYRREF
jgi:hypothetical protein